VFQLQARHASSRTNQAAEAEPPVGQADEWSGRPRTATAAEDAAGLSIRQRAVAELERGAAVGRLPAFAAPAACAIGKEDPNHEALEARDPKAGGGGCRGPEHPATCRRGA
jgi:hypothetical protein